MDSENKQAPTEGTQAQEEKPQILEGLKKGDKGRTVEEDRRLQEQVVSYTPFEELADFEADHEFKSDADGFLKKTLLQMTVDPENWLAQFNAINNLRVLSKYHS